MTKILMVCMGNICRSPMARIVAQQYARDAGRAAEFAFDAAGTHAQQRGELVDSRAHDVLTERHYAVDSIRSRRVQEADFERFDLILAMDKGNLAELERLCPAQLRGKLRLLLDFAPSLGAVEVPDPYYGNRAGFERVLALCEGAAQGLLLAHPRSG
jgi:protein-tyrosine phosphatase